MIFNSSISHVLYSSIHLRILTRCQRSICHLITNYRTLLFHPFGMVSSFGLTARNWGGFFLLNRIQTVHIFTYINFIVMLLAQSHTSNEGSTTKKVISINRHYVILAMARILMEALLQMALVVESINCNCFYT